MQNEFNCHRKTFSGKLDDLKGIQIAHRRTVSNIATKSAKIIKSSLAISNSVSPKEKNRALVKDKGFFSLLDTALTYFNQEIDLPNVFLSIDLDPLRKELENLNKSKIELETTNQRLVYDCETLKNMILEEENNNKNIETSTQALKKYKNQLEKALDKAKIELKLHQDQNKKLNMLISQKISSKTLEKSKKCQKKALKPKIALDSLTPRPINYKPLTQKSLRLSRELSLNNP
jgi:hypothetical protein